MRQAGFSRPVMRSSSPGRRDLGWAGKVSPSAGTLSPLGASAAAAVAPAPSIDLRNPPPCRAASSAGGALGLGLLLRTRALSARCADAFGQRGPLRRFVLSAARGAGGRHCPGTKATHLIHVVRRLTRQFFVGRRDLGPQRLDSRCVLVGLRRQRRKPRLESNLAFLDGALVGGTLLVGFECRCELGNLSGLIPRGRLERPQFLFDLRVTGLTGFRGTLHRLEAPFRLRPDPC